MTDVQPAPFRATFKSAGGFDAPWLTVEAHTATGLKELIEDLNQQGTFAYIGNAAKSFHAAYNVAKVLGPVEVEAVTGEAPHPAQQAYTAFDKAMTPPAAAPVTPIAVAPATEDPWATPAAPAAWPAAAPAPEAAAPAAAPAAAGWGTVPAPEAPVAPVEAPAAAGWGATPTPAAGGWGAAPAAAPVATQANATVVTAPAAAGWGAVATPAMDAGSSWGAAPGAAAAPVAVNVPQVANFGPARVKTDIAKTGPNAGQPYTRYDDPRPWSAIKDFIKTGNPNDPGLLAGTHRFEAYA